MKNTGMTRPIDPLGRIVLPMELRRTLNLNADDRMEIHINGGDIILRKHSEEVTASQLFEEFKEKLTDTQLRALARQVEAIENVVK